MKFPNIAHLLPNLDRLFPPARPTVAASLDEDRLVMVRMGGGSVPKLLGWFAAPVPAGAVNGSPVHVNIPEPGVLRPLVAAAKQAVAPGGGPIALVLPDAIVRVAVIAATELPRGREERREMIAWRLKKILPYRIEDAHVDSQAFASQDGKHLVVAAAVRRKVVAEYEAALASHGFEVGTVTASTLALADLLPSRAGGDTLLLHVGAGWFSMLVTDGREPLIFRSKVLPESERTGAARDEAVLSEIAPTLEYHSGRLNRPPLRRAFVHAAVPGCEDLIGHLIDTLPVRPEALQAGAWSTAPADVAGALAPACALAARGSGEDAAPNGSMAAA